MAEAVGVTDLEDGRALVLVDLWRRGALDAVVANQRGPLLVYRNEPDPDRRWLQVELAGRGANREAYGARVRVEAGGRVQVQAVLSASGFASQGDRVLHFGLGQADSARVEVRWPSGATSALQDVPARQRVRIAEPAP